MRTFIPLAIAVAFALPLVAQAKDDAGESKTTSTSIESLENRYFDHTYPTDTPDERVDRIEKFVFGESSQGTADQRMTKIMATLAADNDLGPTVESQEAAQREKDAAAAAAAAKSNGKQLATRGPGGKGSQLTSYPDPSSQQEPDPSSDDGTPPADYPHITALENEILGQSFVGQPLPTRLSRLEQKAFGAPSTGPLINRTDALEQYAEKTLHKKAFGVNPQMEAQGSEAAAFNDGGSRQQGPGMLNRVANAFLGGGGMGPMGSMGNIGFGAPANSNRGYAQPAADLPERQDSPEVYAAEAPSATSPTLTKVGWCEVQLMGKTFSEMHLMARLRQLNDLLFPNDHESNMQLMDRVDILVKATAAKKAGK